ncbi:MAG: hypothetical protein HYZ53_13615 [Planctomycetes bacterium]|nr:hypothetical protein [Planctomycetota bacterium]
MGVLLLRDSDGCRKRISGIQQAVDSGKWPFETVLGVAHPNRECWVLAGYTPRNAEEQDLLRILREELGFDPCEKAHRLTARSRSQETKRSAKSVLGKLTNGRLEREEECLCADLPLLKKRGREIGLTEYLDQMAVKLVPGVSDATA